MDPGTGRVFDTWRPDDLRELQADAELAARVVPISEAAYQRISRGERALRREAERRRRASRRRNRSSR